MNERRGARARGGPMPVERVRDDHPADPAWRADALAGSRHSRLLDELRLPIDDPDPERAREICAAVSRNALTDFAPALILLEPELRRRAQALAAWALTLFDFAAQTGLEGERLAQSNRWEFELERALAGEPAGQPVFVAMAAEEAARGWPRPALDRIAAAARRRIVAPAATPEAARTTDRELAAACAEALLEPPSEVPGTSEGPEVPGTSEGTCTSEGTSEEASEGSSEVPGTSEEAEPLAALGGALLRLRRLVDLERQLDRGRAGAATWGLEPRTTGDPPTAAAVAEARRAAARRLAGELVEIDLAAAPPAVRRAARYLQLAGVALARWIERRPGDASPPALGALRRVALLVRARTLG